MGLKKRRYSAESYYVAAFLSVTGGFLDAYTYLSRDGVFANAQTGNFARLAISFAGGDFLLVLRYLIPILSFVAGVSMAMWISCHAPRSGKLRWQQYSVLLEIGLLAVVTLVPNGKISNICANVIVSFTCAVQAESFRKVLGTPFASTMCTGNLRNATEYLNQFFLEKRKPDWEKSMQYFGIDVLFVAGAAAGAVLTKLLQTYATLFCCLILSVVFLMLHGQSEEI